jgi:uncharacterized membrane protein YdbT with pleckstrin-like domain
MIKLFPGQHEDEKVICVIHKHWMAYIVHIVGSILITLTMITCFILFFIYYYNQGEIFYLQIATVVLSCMLLSSYFLIFYNFVDHYLDSLAITDKRLIDIKRHGFFRQEINEVHLLDVENVTVQVAGIFPHYMKFGDLHIQTAGQEDRDIVVSHMPKAHKLARLIMEIHTQHINESKRIGVDSEFFRSIDFGFGGKMDLEQKKNNVLKEYLKNSN